MLFNSICRVLASLIWNRDLVDRDISRVALRGIDLWVRMMIDWDGCVPVTNAMQMEIYQMSYKPHTSQNLFGKRARRSGVRRNHIFCEVAAERMFYALAAAHPDFLYLLISPIF